MFSWVLSGLPAAATDMLFRVMFPKLCIILVTFCGPNVLKASYI